MADYTTLTAVKNLPPGIHSASRYLKTFPTGAENAAWADAYKAKYGDFPDQLVLGELARDELPDRRP